MMEQVTSSADLDSFGNLACEALRKPASQWTLSDVDTVWLCLKLLAAKLPQQEFLHCKLVALSVLKAIASGEQPVSFRFVTCDPKTSAAEKSSAGENRSPQ
jgi:hypothetical protein